MNPVKVGVVGAGYWGPNLIRNFHQIEIAELRWVCDTSQERLDHIKSIYPYVQTTKEFDDVLNSDVDAIAIATPVMSHYRLAIDGLRAGKHALIEKPIATTSSEAWEIVQIGKERNKVVLTGHTFLFNPAVVALREIIQSGEIGDIYYINCTRVNLGLYQPDVNVIWDLAPHDVSILMYILGMEPDSTSARGGMYVKPGVHDVAYLTMYFPNGVMADLRVSWLDPNKIRSITIVGSKKMVVYDDIEPIEKVKIYNKGVDVQPYTDTYEEFHLAYRYGEVTPYPIQWDEPLKLECIQFLECIREGKIPRSDGLLGWKVVKILETAQRSLVNGGETEKIK
jgi:predicted dehydrogenase